MNTAGNSTYQLCGDSASCKCFFKGALRATFFAFAIKFSTFNKVFRLRQFCASKSAQLVAAKRYRAFSTDDNRKKWH
jgi:hypothetical protein